MNQYKLMPLCILIVIADSTFALRMMADYLIASHIYLDYNPTAR
jgi:hypothetical protein